MAAMSKMGLCSLFLADRAAEIRAETEEEHFPARRKKDAEEEHFPAKQPSRIPMQGVEPLTSWSYSQNVDI
jgi:hypothetical protein